MRLETKSKASQIEILHYVTIRNKASGELLSAWPYRNRRAAADKFKEVEVANYPSKVPIVIDIEMIDAAIEAYPPQTKKNKMEL